MLPMPLPPQGGTAQCQERPFVKQMKLTVIDLIRARKKSNPKNNRLFLGKKKKRYWHKAAQDQVLSTNQIYLSQRNKGKGTRDRR